MIVFGTTTQNKAVGRVAEVCRGCGGASAFAVEESWQVFHLFFIPLERLSRIGVRIRCETCGLLLGFDRRKYRGIDARKGVSVDELVDATNPALRPWMQERSQFEDRARAGALIRTERVQAITD